MSNSPKKLIFEASARDYLLAGVDKLADIVAFTLCPKGRNIGLEKNWGPPVVTNDGASIIQDIELEDKYENMGVAMAKEVVQKVKEKCGDGTTTAALLLRALVKEGLKLIAAGASPILLKRGLDKAVEQIIKEIEKMSIPVKSKQEIANVATVSASGDRSIGDLIAEAIEKVTHSGAITIEEGKTTETVVEITKGMKFDRGYASSHFCTNFEKMIVEMHQAQVLLVDNKISSIHELLPILQNNAATGKDLLIIAEEFDNDTLSTLVVNKLRGTLKVVAVKSPGFGDRRKAILQDIAVLTGATVVSEEMGMSLKELSPDALGSAEKVNITKDHTTIVGGGGSPEELKMRIQQIEAELKHSTNSYDKEKLEERKAKLTGGVAIIEVGAFTEAELKQKKQRIEDSLNSTRAALEEGIVPGGGLALLTASKIIDSLSLTDEEAMGAKIVKQACEAPLRQIAKNAGLDGSVILHEIAQSPKNFGLNALNDKIEDLPLAGVIDSAKVVKNSLLHAASMASIIYLSEVLVADAPEDEASPAA